jgi:hypothetical protein
MKFFYGDWLRDTSLSSCSPATRGVWMDLLCRMHDSQKWNISGTLEQLARMARCTVPDMTLTLDELRTTGSALVTEENVDVTVDVTENVTVKSVTCNADVREKNTIVTVICRRLQREYSERFKTKLRVRKHRGNGPVTAKKQSPSYSYSYKGNSKVSEQSNVERDSFDSLGNDSNSHPVEPHPKWPRTPEVAIATVMSTGAPETVVLEEWHRANAVGGCNRNGVPIRNWPSYFAACYAARRSREAEKSVHGQASKTGAERAFAGEARSGVTLKARKLD